MEHTAPGSIEQVILRLHWLAFLQKMQKDAASATTARWRTLCRHEQMSEPEKMDGVSITMPQSFIAYNSDFKSEKPVDSLPKTLTNPWSHPMHTSTIIESKFGLLKCRVEYVLTYQEISGEEIERFYAHCYVRELEVLSCPCIDFILQHIGNYYIQYITDLTWFWRCVWCIFELQMPSDVFLVAFWAPSFSSFWSTCSLTKWRPQDKDFLSNRSLLNVQVITNLPQGHTANPGENERRTTWATTLAPNFLTSSGHAEVPLSFGCQCCHTLRLANIRDVLERKFGQSFRNCCTLDFEAMDCMNEM